MLSRCFCRPPAVREARAPSEELQRGLVEGDSVAPRQLPDGLCEVFVEPSDGELLHAVNFLDSYSESDGPRLLVELWEGKRIGALKGRTRLVRRETCEAQEPLIK